MNKQTWWNEPVKFEAISDWHKDCLITLDMFKTWVENRYVGDDDGYGYYATETEESNIFC